MNFIVRKAKSNEGHKLLTLVKDVLDDYNLKINPLQTDKDLLDLESYYFNTNGWFSVLEVDEKIIGSYGLSYVDKTTCELRKMYLLKEFQGKGFGKLLLEDSIAKAKELGYKEIILESNKKLDKALALYLNYGFTYYNPNHLSERCDVGMKKTLD